MSSPTPLRAVFFDVGGTLLEVRPSVGGVYAEFARAHGFDVPAEDLDRRFRRAWRTGLERSRARGWLTSDDDLRDGWWTIVRETFDGSVPAPELRGIFAELYDHFATDRAWNVAPGARETLACLRGLGVKLGVLSNWDSRLPAVLRALDLVDAFDFLVVSHEVGVEKPHPEIFRAALVRAGTDPAETLHVGDSWTADVQAARSLGMRSLWLAPEEERGAVPDPGPSLNSFPASPDSYWAAWVG